MGSSAYLGLDIDPKLGYINCYLASGAIIGNGDKGNQIKGPMFHFLSREDVNDTATQLTTAEGGNDPVKANPTEEATETLNKLQVGETIYEIRSLPQGLLVDYYDIKISGIVPNNTWSGSRSLNIEFLTPKNEMDAALSDLSLDIDSLKTNWSTICQTSGVLTLLGMLWLLAESTNLPLKIADNLGETSFRPLAFVYLGIVVIWDVTSGTGSELALFKQSDYATQLANSSFDYETVEALPHWLSLSNL